MSEQFVTSASEVSFKEFILKNKRNKTILWLIAAAVIIEFGIFKYFYPYANFIHGDSFSYIKAADQNLTINTYLIGYSKFLRLVSVFSKADFTLVSLQFLFIEASALFLTFTIFYFYEVRKTTQVILIVIVVVNPLFLHLGNLVSSDGIFLGLSLLWFSTLLWIIRQHSRKLVVWHSVVLFLAFTFRYNALIYPLISLGVLFFIRTSLRAKLTSISIVVLPILIFTLFTSNQYKKLTGHWQYSPFSGWQLANNAMYTFRYVDSINRKPVPERFKSLHKMVCEYFDSTRNAAKFPVELTEASTVYMWTPWLTLMKYKELTFNKDTTISELRKWASMGPLYKEYGIYIIKKYPKEFLFHFIWPNSKKYYAPPVEFLEVYNTGRVGVSEQAKKWFGYSSSTIKARVQLGKASILAPYPIISGAVNFVLLCLLICYTLLAGWKEKTFINKVIILGSSIWIINAAFTIGASSAALRFQSFPLMLIMALSIIIIDWMIQLMKNPSNIITHKDEHEFQNNSDLYGIKTI